MNHINRSVMLLNTIRYLKPIQMTSRITALFTSKVKPTVSCVPKHRKISLLLPDLDLDIAYISRFSPELIIKKKVTLLNQEYDINFSKAAKDNMSPLAWFNLQYFEYAIAWGASYNQTGDEVFACGFEDAYRKYLAADIPYASYVISLQIQNLIIAKELFASGLRDSFHDTLDWEIFRQYKYLQKHPETHLLGNHYFENLKALVIASYYFSDDKNCRKYLSQLKLQIDEQILPDGMHFELSPMYHKIILDDLMRIAKLGLSPEPDWIKPTIQKMLNALVTLEDGFSRTPLFNDAGDNVAKPKGKLITVAKDILHIEPEHSSALPAAGYYRLCDDHRTILIDGGRIGPDYMPGHGHSDCLSFELSVDGLMLFVNSGTYQYQGDKRKYFRSTKAHNTVVMDSHEQSQCWGEHRVAKRISGVTANLYSGCFSGSYINYCGQKHSRQFELKENILRVLDTTIGAEEIRSYLHIAPGFIVNARLQIQKGNILISTIVPIGCDAAISDNEELRQYALEFGKMDQGSCIVFSWVENSDRHGFEIVFNEKGWK